MKKKQRDISTFAGEQVGSFLSKDVQNGSYEAMRGMELFKEIVKEKYNCDFDQKKGNLFEFIEAAKFNRNSANSGKTVRAIVTHAQNEPHAPDDIRLFDKGVLIDRVQSKVNDFNLPQKDLATTRKAAAVREISNPKYYGMQRNVPLGNKESIEELLDKRIGNGNINEHNYIDTKKNLFDRLTDRRDGTNSGGTTIDELKKASDYPEKYAFDFEMKQYAKEIGITTANIATANAVIKGTVSSVQNFWNVLQDKKNLNEALTDIGVDVTKGAARGGFTGFLSSVFRIGAQKNNIPLLTDSSAATVLAGGVIDTGLSIYAYTKGEITSEELRESLEDTSVKSVSTIYFAKAVEITFGKAAGPFLPIAVYTVSNYVVSTCREIIRRAKLNAAEYDRIFALYVEATKQLKQQREIIEKQLNQYVDHQKAMLFGFLDTFELGMTSCSNYDNAIKSIAKFAEQYGTALKHKDFNEFCEDMKKDEDFIL